MKDNKGITLMVLVIVIILLIILVWATAYTGRQSYKMIDIQKFKSQLQTIQIGLDDFYEKFRESDQTDVAISSGEPKKIREEMEAYLKGIDINGDGEINPNTADPNNTDNDSVIIMSKNVDNIINPPAGSTSSTHKDAITAWFSSGEYDAETNTAIREKKIWY